MWFCLSSNALLMGGRIHFINAKTMKRNTANSTKNVPFGRRKMSSARFPTSTLSSSVPTTSCSQMPVRDWRKPRFYFAEKTYTKTTMKSRLMKYAASTRPTVRKKY